QQTVDSVNLLARIFPEENRVLRVESFGCASCRRQQGKTSSDKPALPHSGNDHVFGGEAVRFGDLPREHPLPIELSPAADLERQQRYIESDEIRVAAEE